MKYKSAVIEKLVSVDNLLKSLSFYAERGMLTEYREKNIQVKEEIEEIQTLLNTEEQEY